MPQVLAVSFLPSFFLLAAVATASAVPLERQLASEARAALVHNHLPLAETLLRGAWEITNDVKLLQLLAQILTMTGQFEEAAETYQLVLVHKPPPDVARQARTEIARLRDAPAPFTDELISHARAPNQARAAFKAGLALARNKKSLDSVRFLRAALVLDPSMPGPYRVLGGTYGKLKDPAREQAFLLDYLRIRPDGRIADTVRERLRPTGLLATLKVDASFRCQIWVNGRPLDKETPIASLLLPPGNHTVSFVNATYHIIRNKRVRLKPNERTELMFGFGVLTLKLKPWARVRANGKDVGLWDAVGLPVGEYDLQLLAYDDSRKKDLTVSIQSGKTLSISTW